VISSCWIRRVRGQEDDEETGVEREQCMRIKKKEDRDEVKTDYNRCNQQLATGLEKVGHLRGKPIIIG
jgi:hypothetical protein